MPLNENHRRRIYLTFKYLDQCLSNAAARLGGSHVDVLFPDYRPDAAPGQRVAVIDCLQRLRAVMTGFLQAQAIPIKEPGTGAVQAFHATLTFARITLEELAPERLAGYGRVDDAAADEIEKLIEEMRIILGEMSDALERGDV